METSKNINIRRAGYMGVLSLFVTAASLSECRNREMGDVGGSNGVAASCIESDAQSVANGSNPASSPQCETRCCGAVIGRDRLNSPSLFWRRSTAIVRRNSEGLDFTQPRILPAGSPVRARLPPDPAPIGSEKTASPARPPRRAADREDRTDGCDLPRCRLPVFHLR